MSKPNNRRRVEDWVTPTQLGEADFKTAPPSRDSQKPESPKSPDADDSPFSKGGTESKEEKNNSRIFDSPPHSENFSDSKSDNDSGGGFDPKMLLGLLGNSMADENPMLGTMLGLLNGEKPDMISMLPLLMSMMNKKETPTQKSMNLDDFTIIN